VTHRRSPLFVEREAYRRRRLIDAARILPLAGLVALLMPVLWVASGGTDTAAEALYLFGLWALLIGTAGALSRPLRDEQERECAGPAAPPRPKAPAAPAPPAPD
jgi:hypothetical protein